MTTKPECKAICTVYLGAQGPDVVGDSLVLVGLKPWTGIVHDGDP